MKAQFNKMFLEWLRDNDHIISESDIERTYQDMLDEYPIKIGSLEYSDSYVLRNRDPIAYHSGLCDFMDSMNFDQLCDYGMESDDYAESLESLWDDFQDEMLVTCAVCGALCPASDAVAIDPKDGHSERACPDCIES